MTSDLIILGAMVLSAMVPFALCARWMRLGKFGFAMTLLSIVGAMLVIFFYGVQTPIGLTPVQAYSWALLFALPALLGGSAGCLVGWILRRRAERLR